MYQLSKHQQVHAVVDSGPRLVILASSKRISEVLLGHVERLIALEFPER